MEADYTVVSESFWGKSSTLQEWDKNQTGSISLEQMTEIYRIYKVRMRNQNYIFLFSKHLQVELKIESVKSRLDTNGQIKKSDFIEHSIEAKLLDLTDSSNARKTVEGTDKRNVKEEKEDWGRKINTKSQVRFN